MNKGAIMIKINYPLLLLIVFIVRLHDASAQNVPVLKDIRIDSYVTFNKSDELFNYAYEMANPKTNTGQITNVQIDVSEPVGSGVPSSQGLVIQEGVDYKGNIISTDFEDAVKKVGTRLNRPLVPVGARPPRGWSAGISAAGTISWGSEEKKYRIMPGQTLTGYVLISRGLPSIRNISVRPKWVLVVEGSVSEEDLEKSKRIEKEITFTGKTIGPTAPPTDFQPTAFLDYLVSLKHEAYNLGWIIQGREDDKDRKKEDRDKKGDEEKGIMKSLDEKLARARERLEKGDNKEAVEKLKSFTREVEALYKEDRDEKDEERNGRKGPKDKKEQKDEGHHEHITSEAYALLKYNAQYLIDQIVGEKKDHREKKE